VCNYCHDDLGCYGWHHYRGCYRPSWGYYEEPPPGGRRGYLEEEKRILEQRLKEIEAGIAEAGK
jgi:hypothetical protein